MTALVLSLLSSPTLLAILGGVIAVVGAFIKGRLDGAKKERTKQAAERQKARTVADEVDNDIGAIPPDQARRELSTWDM